VLCSNQYKHDHRYRRRPHLTSTFPETIRSTHASGIINARWRFSATKIWTQKWKQKVWIGLLYFLACRCSWYRPYEVFFHRIWMRMVLSSRLNFNWNLNGEEAWKYILWG
jgi:hypothetical protein